MTTQDDSGQQVRLERLVRRLREANSNPNEPCYKLHRLIEEAADEIERREGSDYKGMFEQAVRTLAAIDAALGLDDGCGSPDETITAINELKAAEQPQGVAVLSPGGVVTREQQKSLISMEQSMRGALGSAKSCGVPQGLIVATLHAIALQETQQMIDDA